MASMRNKGAWQDWLMLVIGLWLFFAPFFMSYDSLNSTAAMSSYFAGGAVAIASGFAIFSPERWEEWLNLVAGLWLIAAPFGLHFYSRETAAAWYHIVAGCLVLAGAVMALAERPFDPEKKNA